MKMNKAADEQQEQEQDSTNNTKTKTRDLPNLSECQACGFRIDSCAGNSINTIQILYSEWRLLLVCKKCLCRIESSQICSYCFQEVTTDDFLTCCQCKRCVHINCFLNCNGVAPWSHYSRCSKEFPVCVDCWLPKSILKRRESLIFRKNSTHSEDLGSLKNSRVLNGGPQRKIVLGLMAKGMMERKAMVAKSKALDLGVKKDVGGENLIRVSVDDAEVAFRLHKTTNSSPRISKNLREANLSCFHIPKKRDCDGALVLGGSDPGNVELEVSTNKLNENMCRSILDLLKEGGDSCTNNVLLKSSGEETSTNFDSKFSHSSLYEPNSCKVEICEGKSDRFLFKYRKRNSSSKSVLVNESKVEMCNGKPDRYLLKYRKRNSSTKRGLTDKSKISSEIVPSSAVK